MTGPTDGDNPRDQARERLLAAWEKRQRAVAERGFDTERPERFTDPIGFDTDGNPVSAPEEAEPRSGEAGGD